MGQEEEAGTTQVVQRVCGMVRRGWSRGRESRIESEVGEEDEGSEEKGRSIDEGDGPQVEGQVWGKVDREMEEEVDKTMDVEMEEQVEMDVDLKMDENDDGEKGHIEAAVGRKDGHVDGMG